MLRLVLHSARRPVRARRAAVAVAAAVASVAVGIALPLSLAPAVLLDAPGPGPLPTPKQQQAEPDETLDAATGIAFPNTLKVPSRVALPTFTLVGVGVRTVSFLGIKVYSVGFYADLAHPGLHMAADAPFEDKIRHIVETAPCMLRIIPTRNTSFTHLRDGFVKTMLARIRLAKDRDGLARDEEQSLLDPMHKLKSMFPNMPLNKGAFLDIYTHPTSPTRQRLIVFRDIGRIEHNWFAHNFLLAYFEGAGLSPPLKQSVQARLENVALPLRE